ncbi:hypothetical protein J2Z83_001495 [Virgibacillus natechei]|uniref:Uncharacterized protein n=1 Tax=Virgibacillus natechei TaxID=1216297 RepID=A0ABS4IEK1_9BACI|nr:hypothetical protein [Virgibacillus natechei]MBP1969391.1 hypothetical protein [Virgibacillus natechei]UZD11893.1 hypothetical protein OLD84_13205 [Virgibacillus natechei]
MDNRQVMLNSLITIGAVSAIYGITRGVQNGTFQRLPKIFSNAMNNPTIQEIRQPLQNMINNQDSQHTITPSQGGVEETQQQMDNMNQL